MLADPAGEREKTRAASSSHFDRLVVASVDDDDDYDVDMTGGSENAEIAAARRRKAAKGANRGVANLTPEQLAKKRANDREAQRAIRERTKRQIETLERRIEELTNQKPYQELQAVVRAKEAVERENAEIKQKLSSVVSVLQSIVGQVPGLGGGEAQAFQTASTARSAASKHFPVSPANVKASAPPTPSSLSPSCQGSNAAQEHLHSNAPSSSNHSRADLTQQQHQLRHGLDMGPERLELDFLLDSRQRVAKIQSGLNGAQDAPQYRHLPMGHDVTGGQYPRSNDHQAPIPWTPECGPLGIRPLNPPGQHTTEPKAPPAHPSARDDTISSALIDTGDPNIGPIPRYAAPLRNIAPTCPLDSLLLDFFHERRQRTAEGHPVQEVIGPRYPSISSLLNPAHSVYSHPLSRMFTDILAKFPDIHGLPERVAVLYVMFLFMRWKVSSTKQNYDRLMPWMRPSMCQILTPHPAWVDLLPFPRMREALCRLYDQEHYHFDNFFIPYTTTIHLSWPYEATDALLCSPDSDEILINPVFERHLRNLDNWKLGDAFARAFPSLADTCNIDSSRTPATVDTRSGSANSSPVQ